MKIGITSDIHLDEFWGLSKPDPIFATSRLLEIRDEVGRIFEIFKQAGTSLILDGGDIFHAKGAVSIPVVSAFTSLLTYKPCPIITVPSNHGSYDRVGIFNLASAFQCLDKDFHVVSDGYYCFVFQSVVCFGVSFIPDNKIDDFAAKAKVINSHIKHLGARHIFILMHQAINEAKIKNSPIRLNSEISFRHIEKYFPEAELVVIGHFHDPQQLSKQILIPGAVCQHNFGDANGKRGAWIYDTDNKKLQYIPTKAPSFHVVEFSKLKTELNTIGEKDYVRVLVKSTDEVKEAKELLYPRTAYFKLQKTETEAHLRDESMTLLTDEAELLSKYYDHKQPPLKKTRVMDIGRKAIEKTK